MEKELLKNIEYVDYLFWIGYGVVAMVGIFLVILIAYLIFNYLLRFKRVRNMFRNILLFNDIKNMTDNEVISLINSIEQARK